jgi:hypothetical protein
MAECGWKGMVVGSRGASERLREKGGVRGRLSRYEGW